MYNSLGHLPRAPLVYTVAMVEYATVPKIESYINDIMESLRSEYPDIGEYLTQSWAVDFKETGAIETREIKDKNWRLNNVDCSWGVSINESCVILQTTKYTHFDEFSNRLTKILEVICRFALIEYTKKIGIRYIDNILVNEQLSLAQQVKNNFLNPDISTKFSHAHSRMEYAYTSEEGVLYLRCFNLKDHPCVPQDLVPLVQQLVDGSMLMKPITENFLLLDTDHIYVPTSLIELNIDHVIKKLDLLHQGASMAFRHVVTEEALTFWEAKNVC
jgi:uncharacterized protein (TIGR04255 family)